MVGLAGVANCWSSSLPTTLPSLLIAIDIATEVLPASSLTPPYRNESSSSESAVA